MELTETKTNSNIGKQVMLASSAVVAALICFGLIKLGYNYWYLYLVAPVIFVAIWGVYLLIAENIWINIISSILIAAIALLFFHSSWVDFVWAIVLCLFLIICRRDVKKELSNIVHIRAYEVVRDYIKWFLIVIAILIGLVFFNASNSGQISVNNIKLPQSWRVDILSLSLPEFSTSTTVNQLVNMLNGRDVNDPVSSQEKATTLKAIGTNENIVGGSIASQNEQLMSMLVDKRLNQAIEKMGNLVPIVFAIIIWQLMSLAYYLLLPIYLMFVELLFVLLIKTGFLSINKESVQKDIVELQ